MQYVLISISVLSLLVTYILSISMWYPLKIARATGIITHDESYLRQILTKQIIHYPPPEINKWSCLQHPSGYGHNMGYFEYADHKAIFSLMKIWNFLTKFVLVASGVVGYFAFGWWGVLLSVLNLLIVLLIYMGATLGEVGDASIKQVVQNLQIKAVILYKWYNSNPEEVRAWVEQNPHMSLMAIVVSGIDD